MDSGYLIGVFGTRQDLKSAFESSIAKKNEAEGIIIYVRSDEGTKYSYLDDASYPEKIQGYSRIASISDYAHYVFPTDGKLSSFDGELAVLLDAYSLKGSVEIMDSQVSAYQDMIKSTFNGVSISSYPLEERSSKSSVMDLSRIKQNGAWPKNGTLIYIDRAFNVKGVGLVVLGFVLCGRVSVHDRLRLIPSSEKFAEVKGIQVNDEDQDSVGRGMRVGLSLKGVELKDLEKISWLDDGSFNLDRKLLIEFNQSRFYKNSTEDRDIHVQCNGELIVARMTKAGDARMRAIELQSPIPVWEEMRLCLIDLNGKPLRVMGGGIARTGVVFYQRIISPSRIEGLISRSFGSIFR